jgi:hypothetical protein
MGWLSEAVAKCALTSDMEEYLYGRGAQEATILDEGCVTWHRLEEPSPDPVFAKRYGNFGERLEGFLVIPVRSPKGSFIGMEARNISVKYLSDWREVEAEWNPFMIGTRRAVEKLWAGGDAWIVEGFFDKCPLEWVVPSGDAVLATVTAKLAIRHVEFLRRHCRGWVHMVYDRDEAGRRGSEGYADSSNKRHWGALDALRRVGLKCRDVPYSGGKDPGELWDRGGVQALKAAFPTI